jgi:hypothetical protein
MKIVLEVNKSKFKFFLELVQSLDFVTVERTEETKEDTLKSIEEGFKEMKQFNDGKLKLKNARDLINEL